MRWAAVFCLGAGLGLSACAIGPPTDVAARDDQFRPYREVETATYMIPVHPGMMQLRLTAHIERTTGAVTTLIKVKHAYTGQHRHNYGIARNERAEQLKLNVVARYGNCRVRTECPLDELYTIEVPETELRAATTKGYRYQVFPQVGPDILVTVPAPTIAAFFALLDKETRGPATASITPAQKAAKKL